MSSTEALQHLRLAQHAQDSAGNVTVRADAIAQALAIAHAAEELHTFLWRLTGDTADWPVRITVADDYAQELNHLLNRLKKALPSQ